MEVCHRVLTFLGTPMFGCPPFCLVISSLVLFPIIVESLCLSMFLMSFPLVQTFGSLTPPSLAMRVTSNSSRMPGPPGVPPFPAFLLWLSGGKWGRASLKDSIRFCCDRAAARSKNRDLLVRLKNHLKAKVDASSVSCFTPYQGVLKQIAELDLEAARGAQVRSRIRWVEEGETSSANFLRLEKKNAADRWVAALREDDGTIVSSPQDLCRSFASFYTSLFTAEATDETVQASLIGNLPSSLSSEQASQCEPSFPC